MGVDRGLFPWSVTQDYGVQNADEPGGWHHGVDYAAPGGTAIASPARGTYDPTASTRYDTAIDYPNGELLFMHVTNPFFGQGEQPVDAGETVGTVLAVNPENGRPFGPGNQAYRDSDGGTYWETGPHLHLEAHSVQGAHAGSDQGIESPGDLLGGMMALVPGYTGISTPGPATGPAAIGATTPLPGASTVPATAGHGATGGCQHSILGLCLDGAVRGVQRGALAAVLLLGGGALILAGINHAGIGLRAGGV